MAQLNQYSLYTQILSNQLEDKKDEIDTMIDEIRNIMLYEDAKIWFSEHFGDMQGENWLEYPEMDKKIYTRNNDERIEICMLFKNKQYFGRGWKNYPQKQV